MTSGLSDPQVFVVVPVAGKVDVVNPDLVSFLNAKGIADIGNDPGDLYVANNDIALPKNTEPNTVKN